MSNRSEQSSASSMMSDLPGNWDLNSMRRKPPNRHVPDDPGSEASLQPSRFPKTSSDEQASNEVKGEDAYDKFMSAIDGHLEEIPRKDDEDDDEEEVYLPGRWLDTDDDASALVTESSDEYFKSETPRTLLGGAASDDSSAFYTEASDDLADDEKSFDTRNESSVYKNFMSPINVSLEEIPRRSYKEALYQQGTNGTWEGSDGTASVVLTLDNNEYGRSVSPIETGLPSSDNGLLSQDQEKTGSKSKYFRCAFWIVVFISIAGIAIGFASVAGVFSSSDSDESQTPAPSKPSKDAELVPSQIPVIAPTGSPSSFQTLTPTEILKVNLTVVIQTDQYPENTGWTLNCDSHLLAELPQGYYTTALEVVTESFEVNEDSVCTFWITDADEDGLCCEFGIGYYRIYYEEDILLVGGSRFGAIEEVDFVASSSAVAVTPTPTVSPAPSLGASPNPTRTKLPSQFPSLSPAPTGTIEPTGGTVITVALQLDEYPSETGWSLQCDDIVLAKVPSNTYSISGSFISETFSVDEGSSCQLSVTDASANGDGLCCGFGEGFYQVYYGNDITDEQSLLLQGSSFRFAAQAFFAVSTPSKTAITVAIQMDVFPQEISWSLECDGEYLAVVPETTYAGSQLALVSRTFFVEERANCRFIIADSFGDGLCCSQNSGVGYYQVYFGKDISDDNLILVQGSEFRREEQTSFLAASPLS